jgi:AcrR family transcriptional regulator
MPGNRRPREAATAARRAQIITATTETIAEIGYRRTTFARIAERGGLSSTRLISYHFASKDELVQAVVADVYASIDQFLTDRMSADTASRPIRRAPGTPEHPHPNSAGDELRAYITGVVTYIEHNLVRMRALQSIFAALYDEEDNPATYGTDTERGVLAHIENFLRRGQTSGEFRAFDTFVMAAAIQRSLDRLPFLLAAKPDLDLQVAATELVTLFDLATKS